MVAESPKHDRNCTGSFLLTPSKYLRTTSSAIVSDSCGSVVPDVEGMTDSSVAAFNLMAEDAKFMLDEVENADTREVDIDAIITDSTAQSRVGCRKFRQNAVMARDFDIFS